MAATKASARLMRTKNEKNKPRVTEPPCVLSPAYTFTLESARFNLGRLRSLGNFESISCPAHGSKITRRLRVGLNFFPDAANVDVDRTRRDEAGIAPDCVEEVIAAEDTAGMTREIVEQPELGGGGGHQLTIDAQLHGAGINLDVFEADHRRRRGALEAAQDGFDAGDQFTRGEGLGDVIVGAHFKAEDAIVLRGAGGEKDDGDDAQRRVLAETPAQVESVAAGNHDVQKKKVQVAGVPHQKQSDAQPGRDAR